MAKLLKDIMNKEYIQKLANEIKTAYSEFDIDSFVISIMDETWDSLELKARWRHITLNFYQQTTNKQSATDYLSCV